LLYYDENRCGAAAVVEVRLIQNADVEALVELARAMHAEGKSHQNITFEAPVMRGWFTAAVNQPNEFFCNVATKGGEIIGAMLACRAPYVFSFDQKALELGLYILPKHRGGLAAYRMVCNFIRWAKEQNCKNIKVGVTIGIDDSKAIKFYERMGFAIEGPILNREVH
jgi:RimJ/RimL family protein N-acetyltransferase